MPIKAACWVFFLTFLAVISVGAQETPTPVATPSPAETLYHQALDAYLDGDYDSSIALAAQSLSLDPNFQKSKNLLNVLGSEKTEEGKSVIWLSGVPYVVTPTPEPAAPPVVEEQSDDTKVERQIDQIRDRLNNLYYAEENRDAHLSGQMNAIQQMFNENANGQYDEIKKNQEDLYNRLSEIKAGKFSNSWLLYLLCILSLLFSLVAVSKGRKRAE